MSRQQRPMVPLAYGWWKGINEGEYHMGQDSKSQALFISEVQDGVSQSAFCDNQKLGNNQKSPQLMYLTPESVVEALVTMLQQEQPSLSEKALYLEGSGRYRQIESLLPLQRFRYIEMSPEIVRGLALQALRRCGNSLGVETQFDKLFLLWTRGS